MPKHTGTKYRTIHKFGTRRKKRKSGVQSSDVSQKDSDVEATTSHGEPSTSSMADAEVLPSTSSGEPSNVASRRKVEYFSHKKRKFDSSDEESDEAERPVSVEGEQEFDNPATPELNFIINLGCLQSLIAASGALCPECKEPYLTVAEGGKDFRKGSSCLLELRCTDCGKLSADWTSQRSGSTHTGYDVNRRLVTAATASGLSYSQTKRLFALMGMPSPMSEPSWYFYKTMAVQRFNMGSSAMLNILVELELLTTTSAAEYAEEEDTKRVRSATKKASTKEKAKRKRVDAVRRQERQARQEREGDVYGAGEF